MRKSFGVLLAVGVSGCVSAPQEANGLAMTFEDLGCGGEWPYDKPQEASIVRKQSEDGTSFEITHPATCGLSARRPAYSVSGAELALRYELYSQTGTVVMCDCAYASRFTFSGLPSAVQSISFTWSEHER